MRKPFIPRSFHRFLVACVFVGAYGILVHDVVTGEADTESLLRRTVVATIVAAIAIGLLWALGKVFAAVARRSARKAEPFVLPDDAFQVRISFRRLLILNVVMTVAALLVGLAAYRYVWGDLVAPSAWLFVYLAGLVVLHELSHAAGWLMCGMPAGAIRFGIMWHLLAPYANCSLPMSMRVYRFTLALPTFTTGLLPLAIGLYLGDMALVVASGVLIGGAAGDAAMLSAGVAFHPDTRVMDHPAEPAFIILDKGNLPVG